MTEEETTQNRKRLSKRDFLKLVAVASGSAMLAYLGRYLNTKDGQDLIEDLKEGNYWKKNIVESDEGSRRVLNLYNETLSKSELTDSKNSLATKELVRRRNIVFAAVDSGIISLGINLDKDGKSGSVTNISHDPTHEITKINIILPNKSECDIDMVNTIAHEIDHVYQYLEVLDFGGYKNKEMDNFMSDFGRSPKYETDAWIVGNLTAYLYFQTYPNDLKRGIISDPHQTGIDQIGFTEYWLNRKNGLTNNFGDDPEYRWFLERYGALVDVFLDISTGKDQPLLFPLTVRDSQVGEDFILRTESFYVPTGWSESIGLSMDPTERNIFIKRHFNSEPNE